ERHLRAGGARHQDRQQQRTERARAGVTVQASDRARLPAATLVDSHADSISLHAGLEDGGRNWSRRRSDQDNACGATGPPEVAPIPSVPEKRVDYTSRLAAALYAIIFVTGGATLAMELLASRVMTPYFGVSLYIWTGILSITRVALALGYWAGGRLAAVLSAGARAERLFTVFLLMPALAALALVGACLAYPHVFPLLAAADLVTGSFVACVLLLGVPLVTASAMNPLLIAIRMRARAAGGTHADAGAGRVFFVSTVGSVAGVLATAFWLIPRYSNFVSLTIVALVLALLPV